MTKQISVALEAENQLLQKYLAVRAVQERELRITIEGKTITGFVTGLDDRWVQICNSKDETATLLNQDLISQFEETRRSLVDLPQQQQDRIRSFSELFSRIAAKELESILKR